MPDLDLVTNDGPRRVHGLLHEGRAVLLELGGASLAQVPSPDRIRCLQARCDGPWALPALGTVTAPSGVLIRPDGYVAWVGEGDSRGLSAALSRWCGVTQG
jgi:3-(3-hydroxy-phenyl)propionate hydroxylase